jgi:hypothetical protein
MAMEERKVHPNILGNLAYWQLSKSMGMSGEHLENALAASTYMELETRAKNGIERIALSQMVLAQGRTAWLSELATRQTQPKSLAVVLEACERASSTFARLMRVFHECRQPRSPVTTVSIGVGQANLAAQQVVQNVENQTVNGNTDKQTRIQKGEVIDAEVIPSVKARTTVAEGGSEEKSTMEMEHRPKNLRRKESSRDELVGSRRKVHRPR